MKFISNFFASLFGKKKKKSKPTPPAMLTAVEIEEYREVARKYMGERPEWPKVNELINLAQEGLRAR